MAPHDNELSSPTCAAPAGWYGADWDSDNPKTGWYFFYGTLTDPTILAEVIIGSRDEPFKLRPARIDGYETMLWGPHPALVEGKPDNTVRGAALSIETTTQARRLQGYATNAFKIESCRICFEVGEGQDNVVAGQSFVWDKPREELKEGQFDLQEYLSGMSKQN